ncbi:hypothetical protein R6Z07F_018042 [Ovis aries]
MLTHATCPFECSKLSNTWKDVLLDFPSSPVLKTLYFQRRGTDLIPGSGTRSHVLRSMGKRQKKHTFYLTDAQSLQSCLTLCDPMVCSPPGSSVHGILQAGTLEWVAVSFSSLTDKAQGSGSHAASLPCRPFTEGDAGHPGENVHAAASLGESQLPATPGQEFDTRFIPSPLLLKLLIARQASGPGV